MRKAGLLLLALCLGAAHAAPIVVTPGTNAGYMYFPATGSGGSGSSAQPTGVGGVSIQKTTSPEPYTGYTVSANVAGVTPCGSGCTYANFNTGAGFVTLTSSRPTIWMDSSKNVLTNCEATTQCVVWVTTNTQLQIKTRPACFEGDITSLGDQTCTVGSKVYSTNLSPIGKYAGKLGSKHLVASMSDDSSGSYWGTFSCFTGATSTSDGQSNTAQIVTKINSNCGSYNTPTPAAKICADKGSAWYLPARDELQILYNNRSAIGGFSTTYYWSSTERDSYNAWFLLFNSGSWYAYDSKYATYAVRCVRSF